MILRRRARRERSHPRGTDDARGDETDSIPDQLRTILAGVINAVPTDFGGGSTLNKATAVASLMLSRGLDRYLEVGVYKGRSLFPAASVCQWLGSGMAVGIDPYAVNQALQQDESRFPDVASGVNTFVSSLDWDELYLDVEKQLAELELAHHCRLIRSTSKEASRLFREGSIDVLHIDGNHDEAHVREDVQLYLPKVKAGGILVLDDASWATVASSKAELTDMHRLIYELCDDQNDFAVFSID